MLVTPEPLARSAGGLTLSLAGRSTWAGASDRSHLCKGLISECGWCRPESGLMGTFASLRACHRRRVLICGPGGVSRHRRAEALASAREVIVFGALSTVEGASSSVLSEVAREFSPRIEVCGRTEIVLDLSGLARLFGDARTIAEELRRTAADRGRGARGHCRHADRSETAGTCEPGSRSSSRDTRPPQWRRCLDLLGELSSDFVAELGTRESRTLSSESRVPDRIPDVIATFRRWGLRTLGDLAALPADDLAARLGRQETDWQRLARGEDTCPLVPAVPEERFEQSLDLEWPIEEPSRCPSCSGV